MGTHITPAPDEEDRRILPGDVKELITFLREDAQRTRESIQNQVDANRAALNTQAEADRQLLRNALWLISVPLTIIISVATWFGIKDVNSIEHLAQATLNTTIQENKAAIASEKLRNAELIAQVGRDAKEAEQVEIEKANKQLQAKFSDENIQKTIVDAAKSATEGKAKILIDERVHGMIDPLVDQAKSSVEAIQIQQQIAGASADDAPAFDRLQQLRQSAPPEQQKLIDTFVAHRQSLGPQVILVNANIAECADPSSEPIQQALHSKKLETRERAVSSCSEWIGQTTFGDVPHQNETLLDIHVKLAKTLANVALNETSLSLRAIAINALNGLFHGSPDYPVEEFPNLEIDGFRAWWSKHERDCEVMILLARTSNPQSPYMSSIETFDELKRRAPTEKEPAYLKKIEIAMTTMRENARDRVKLEQNRLEKQEPSGYSSASCKYILQDIENDLPRRTDRTDLGGLETRGPGDMFYSALPELHYVPSCKTNEHTIGSIAAFAATTASLPGRYEALKALRTITGLNLDAFDTESVQAWWTAHKGDYPR